MTVYPVICQAEGGKVLSAVYDNPAAAALHAALLGEDLVVESWVVQSECRVDLPPEATP